MYGMGLFLLLGQLEDFRMAGKPSYEELEQKVTELEKEAVEHKKVKDKLKLFSHSFESSIDGLAMGNTENRITYVNETFSKMYGYSREELVGKKIALIYPDDQLPLLEEALKITMEGGWTGELIGKKKDGTRFPVSVSSSRVLDDQGNVITHIASHRDITQEKQAVEALRESEEKYHTLFADSKDAIFITTRNGEFIDFNQSFLDLFGYTEEEIKKTNSIERYAHPNDRVTFKKEVEEKGSVKDFEVTLQKKDGTKIYALMTATLWLAHDGSILGYQGITRDITEQKQTLEALRESEAEKKAILDASIDRIRLSDTDMRIIWANQAHERELNIHLDKFIGQHCYTFFVKRDTPCLECPSVKALASGNIEHSIMARPSPGNKGETTYLDSYAVPIKNKSGAIESLIQVTRNITEQVQSEKALRKSEEKYRTILESIEEGYYELDLTGNFTFFNNSTCKMLGYRRNELLGMNNREFTDKKNAKRMYKIFNRVYKTGKSKNIADIEIIRKKAGRRNIETSVSPMKDSKGNATGFRGIFRDVTEHKRAERAMKKREAELASVNKQLIETNKALSVLAKNLDTTQKESENRIIQRIRSYILPIIEKLKQDKNIDRYRADFDLLTGYIRELTSSLTNDIKIAIALSTTELRIASLIRNGMSNQEIARHLYITLATVKTHRKNIRRKLDLHNSGINLKAYMKSELDQE